MIEDTLTQALKEVLVNKEHKLDQLDELISYDTYIEAVGIKDGKARIIYVPKPKREANQ